MILSKATHFIHGKFIAKPFKSVLLIAHGKVQNTTLQSGKQNIQRMSIEFNILI